MHRKWIIFILRILIAAVVLSFLVINIDLREIQVAFSRPRNLFLIIIACVLLIPNICIQWMRWHFLLRLNHDEVGISESFASLMGGMVVGLITPGRIGELGRSLFLSHADRVQALGLVFLDKFYSLVVILLGGIWGIITLVWIKLDPSFYIVWPLVVLGVLCSSFGISVLLHPHWVRMLLSNLALIFPFRQKLRRFIASFDAFDTRRARTFLFFSFSLYIIFILQFSLLALAFENVSVLHLFVSTTSTFFTKSLLPIAVGDLGIREGASIFFFMQFGVQKVTAFNSSILLFTINVLMPSVFGLIFLPRLNIGHEPGKVKS